MAVVGAQPGSEGPDSSDATQPGAGAFRPAAEPDRTVPLPAASASGEASPSASATGAALSKPAPVPSTPGKAAKSASKPPADAKPSRPVGAADVDHLVGQQLGEFKLLRMLGKGGMSVVYLAEQTSLKRNVAVKILKQELCHDGTYIKRFKTEAQAAAGLAHPNIVQVYMVGEDRQLPFIAQEYIQGWNLKEYLQRKGPPDLTLALHVMKQVAAALQCASTAGVVHRDIKPENIMLTRKGEVKVADFGLAQVTTGGERLHLTQEGVTMGTPLYMSPEQVNGSHVDARSDIYSFGVTCYHLLSGQPPFRGETALAVAVQHLQKEPAPLTGLRPDLPEALCQIVHRMMTKKVAQRYQSAQDVLKDLKRVTAGQAVSQPRISLAEMPTVATGPVALGGARDRGPWWSPVGWLTALWELPERNASRFAFAVGLSLLVAVAAGTASGARQRQLPVKAGTVVSGGHVPVKKTAAEQYFYAAMLGDDEAAWKAVVTRFPADLLEKQRAQQQLALLYLRQRRYDEANALFDLFSAMSPSEPEWQVFGQAGKAIVLSQRGDRAGSKRLLDQVQPNERRLDPRLQPYLQEARTRNTATRE